MRALAIVAALAGVAHADAKADVDKLVRAHIAASVDKQKVMYATLPDGEDAALFDASGSYLSLFACDAKSDCSNDVPLFGSSWVYMSKPIYSNVKPTVRVDGKLATFYATADLAADLSTEGAARPKGKTQMRIAGIARQDKTGWKIVAAKFAAAVPDSALLAKGQVFTTSPFAPKAGLEKEVASWFGHLADHQSANAIGANGTAPAELATDAAGMTKLVKSWDKLDLVPLSFDAREYGDAALIHVNVKLTTKKTAVEIVMALVVVKEGAAWKWVAIDFGTIFMTEQAFR